MGFKYLKVFKASNWTRNVGREDLEALPNLCSSICRSLAEQESLSKWVGSLGSTASNSMSRNVSKDAGFLDAAEFLYLAADGFGEFMSALTRGRATDFFFDWVLLLGTFGDLFKHDMFNQAIAQTFTAWSLFFRTPVGRAAPHAAETVPGTPRASFWT